MYATTSELRSSSTIAFGDDLITTNGRKVRAHTTAGQRRWVHTARDRVVAVRHAGSAVLVLEACGRLLFLESDDGRPRRSIRASGEVTTGLATGPDELWAILGPRHVVLGRGLQVIRRLKVFNAACAAFSTDGRSLAIGTRPNTATGAASPVGGRVALYDLDQGRLRQAALPRPVTALAWSSLGSWLVGQGHSVERLDPSQLNRARPLLHLAERPVQGLAVSPDGRLAACRLGEGRVELFGVLSGRPLGRIAAPGRQLGEVALGERAQLALAVDAAGSYRVALRTGEVQRAQKGSDKKAKAELIVEVDGAAVEAEEQRPLASEATGEEEERVVGGGVPVGFAELQLMGMGSGIGVAIIAIVTFLCLTI